MPATADTSLAIPEISCVNPLAFQRGLEQLFADHGRPDHAEFFTRAYPGAVEEGAKAWIGLDDRGTVVMHASRFPHAFLAGGEKLTGGLIVNILVAKPYRTHHPARALFQRFIEDSREDREVDFLYTETTPRGANVLTAAGARIIGRIVRFVLPIRGKNKPIDLAVRMYCYARRLTIHPGRLKTVCHPAARFDASAFHAPQGNSDRLRGVHGPQLYRRRLRGYPADSDHWITVEGSAQEAAALVRLMEGGSLASVVKLAFGPEESAARILLATIPPLRSMGCRAVQIYTVAESAFASDLRRAGFVARESQPLVAVPISPAGRTIVDCVANWQITEIDLDN